MFTGCPPWQYTEHPSYKTGALRASVRDLYVDIARGQVEAAIHIPDTRLIHTRLFRELTVKHYEYYAGHYRGSISCLVGYEVNPKNDPTTTYERSDNVPSSANQIASRIRDVITELDRVCALPEWQVSRARKLASVVALACDIFCAYLLIHPYADGNGHAARFIVVALLFRYGFRLGSFPIEPRPAEPYVEAIRQHRLGNKTHLQERLIRAVIP